MTVSDALQVAAAVLLSLGGGGAIVLSLSSWLGKLWADRLMQEEKSRHEKELEDLRSDLQRKNEAALAELRAALDIEKEKHLSGFGDKVKTYRLVVDVIADALADFDLHESKALSQEDAAKAWDRFNRARMKAYGYLAMLAPQGVMDAADALFDHLLMVGNGARPYEWAAVRELAFALINPIRRDIGFDASVLEYHGIL